MIENRGLVIHFSGLNGIRAIAALAVLFSHITHSLDEFGLNKHIFGTMTDGSPKATMLAGYGVSMFFSLSGFLITYLLLLEKENGKINIKNFYLRRILRIWPLYFLYFLIALITTHVFDITYDQNSIIYYLVLSANIPYILGTSMPFLGHYWSLGVEEQFYLFWPILVSRIKGIFNFSVATLLALIVLKLFFRYLDFKYGISIFYTIIGVIRFDCMLIGALGAIILYTKRERLINLLGSVYAQLAAWLILLLSAINLFHIASVIDDEIIALATLVIIIGQLQKKNRLLNLDKKVFNFLGKISFGIYVIHPILIYYAAKLHFRIFRAEWLNYVWVYVVVFSATLFFAYLSYELFEKRFLRVKAQYARVKSSDTKPLQD